MNEPAPNHVLDHLFRHQYGFLVAALVRRFSIHHIELIEDSVQWSLAQALVHWRDDAVPDNHSAWLYKVAFRCVVSQLEKDTRHQTLLDQQPVSEPFSSADETSHGFTQELTDSLLRMLFIACDDSVPMESQMVFTLKSLCGFNADETAARLFISKDNVYKRYDRAKKQLRLQDISLDELSETRVKKRMPAVHNVLYLVFTEGYLSSHPDLAIRKELCDEAIRLTQILAEHQWGNSPSSKALLALMYLNLARFDTRQDHTGLLLLEDQNRADWNQQDIYKGLALLSESAKGDILSRYHLEASIAAQHCLASSIKTTRWDLILKSYELLEKVSPSPLRTLSRAVALAEVEGAKAALTLIYDSDFPSWLTRTYHWYAVVADLEYRAGQHKSASLHAQQAIEIAPSVMIKRLLARRMSVYSKMTES